METEFAKLLGTLGFDDYASTLWNLAADAPKPQSDVAFKDAFGRHVREQARFDPAVAAPGLTRLPLLRRMLRDLPNTRHAQSSRLLDRFDDLPRVIILIAKRDDPTADRVAEMTGALSRVGAGSCLVIATEEGSQRDSAPNDSGDCSYVFWQDRFAGDPAASARHLALLLYISGAHSIIVLDSPLGLAILAQYGLALRQGQRLFAAIEVPATQPFVDIHHLRLVAPHATILARSLEDAEALRAHAAGIDGFGISVWTDDPQRTFGTTFEDSRSTVARTVCTTLLGRSGAPPGEFACDMSAVGDVDLTVAILFHRERELAVPALASLAAMVEAARNTSISIEAIALIDRGDDATRAVVADHGGHLDDIRHVDFGSPALARNAAAKLARGRYLAFLDGDDLWGTDWLWRGYRAVVSSPGTIWHPEVLYAFWASDCDRKADADLRSSFLVQQSSDTPTFDRRDLLLENMWSVNAIAATALHRRFPYRADDWQKQIGIEDWRWNLETLGQGIRHAIVPETLHAIRIKEAGSFGQLHQAKALLPFFE